MRRQATKTFPGGVHPPENKTMTQDKPIQRLEAPAEVVIPVLQHIGAPCEPVVHRNERVLVGQLIANSERYISAPVHSSVSGTVRRVDERPDCSGRRALAIVIENDGAYESAPPFREKKALSEMTPQEIVQAVRAAGVVGLGGAGFPTHVKLSPPKDKQVHTVLLNGCECEPYLTADHRTMVESPGKVITGMAAIARAVRAKRAFVAVEDNKPDAIAALKQAISEPGGVLTDLEEADVITLETKYPQGAEKQLIKATTGQEVPAGGLPADVGVVVSNVGTAVAVVDALEGIPLTQRVVTLAGDVASKPGNYLVPLGTTLEDFLELAGGCSQRPRLVLAGGPMMGLPQPDLAAPITKAVGGVLVFSAAHLDQRVRPCIRCARCVDACPARLLPNYLHDYAMIGNWEKADVYGAKHCIECGSCSYVCPAKRPLVHRIRMAKEMAAARARKEEETSTASSTAQKTEAERAAAN